MKAMVTAVSYSKPPIKTHMTHNHKVAKTFHTSSMDFFHDRPVSIAMIGVIILQSFPQNVLNVLYSHYLALGLPDSLERIARWPLAPES